MALTVRKTISPVPSREPQMLANKVTYEQGASKTIGGKKSPAGLLRGLLRDPRAEPKLSAQVRVRAEPATASPELGMISGPYPDDRELFQARPCLSTPARWALKGSCRSVRTRLIAPAAPPTGSR